MKEKQTAGRRQLEEFAPEFAHIAITAGKSEFYEAVSDEEYSRLG
ncbi:TPA: hypothetical protein ACI0D3_002028 [Streptococcus agalactiae]